MCPIFAGLPHHHPAFWPALWGRDRALSSMKGSGGCHEIIDCNVRKVVLVTVIHV